MPCLALLNMIIAPFERLKQVPATERAGFQMIYPTTGAINEAKLNEKPEKLEKLELPEKQESLEKQELPEIKMAWSGNELKASRGADIRRASSQLPFSIGGDCLVSARQTLRYAAKRLHSRLLLRSYWHRLRVSLDDIALKLGFFELFKTAGDEK